MTNGRVVRGRQTERLLAEYLQSYWPDAVANSASLAGDDVRNCGRLAIEVKATNQDPVLSGLRQVHARSDETSIPLVVYRPNGYGPERIGLWVVATRVDTFFGKIAPLAGYFND